jgi:multidrug efflux pump
MSENVSENEKKSKVVREFKLTTFALKNRNTVFLLTTVIFLFGLLSYVRLPKELFPDVSFPTVMVQTTYFGNPPVDIENLVTRPIEKEIESVNGIKEIRSTSAQDASMIFVEFNPNIDIDVAKAEVKDKVDIAKNELPDDDRLSDPLVMDFDMSDFPVISVNLYGDDFSKEELKEYAEYLEDKIESISEISSVEIKGIEDKEIHVYLDLYKMEAMQLTFNDIQMAVAMENVNMSGGEIKVAGTRRSIRIIGEFEEIKDIEKIIVKRERGKVVYLKDVAKVEKGYKETSSYSRLDDEKVVTLRVIKKKGENLLSAIDKVSNAIDEARENKAIPFELSIVKTEDMSEMVRLQLANLENSIIMGVIFVVMVLFFFLGIRNAMFVGIAIPLSMMLSFIILSVLNYKINMIVLFSLILALGMLVDNAIVVVENIYRFVDKGHPPFHAARLAVGEIAWPIITSTATTLAAFFTLIFWHGIVGEFMKYLPITLIIVLTSSLFVALIIVPVFSATFISMGNGNSNGNGAKNAEENKNEKKKKKKFNRKPHLIAASIMIGLSLLLYLVKVNAFASLLMIFALLGIAYALVLHKAESWFQEIFLAWLEKVYHKLLSHALRKYNPLFYLGGAVFLLIFAIVLFIMRAPQVNFFPVNEPGIVYIESVLPLGTDIDASNDFMLENIEKDIEKVLISYDTSIVENILTTVGVGLEGEFSVGGTPHKALTTITFVDFEDRKNIQTSDIMKSLSNELIGKYPGVEIAIEKDAMGPPVGKPINIEISGEDYDELIKTTSEVKAYLESFDVPGIEGLKLDLSLGKPEAIVHIDRDKAMRYGVSTMSVANTISTALYGREISKFKEGEDEYPIMMKLKDEYRYNLNKLMNQKITIYGNETYLLPISAVADIEYSTSYSSVKRKDLNRVITLYSNVIEGYNANQINAELKTHMKNYKDLPEGYEYEFTGEQEEQADASAFMMRAMAISLALILLILVSQFNSLIKPLIIFASILFSTIGVFGGLAIFKMDFVIVMTGVGIISLAGIVVNNAIVLIDYIELLKKRKKKELCLGPSDYLPVKEATECIVNAGRTRLRPVLLTAITTVLGLISLAVGFNIDFAGLLSQFKPDIYFGGEMVIFWGPMSWTVIFGLTFSTFLTLVLVPVMYRITILVQKKLINLSVKFFPGINKVS